MSPWGWLAVSSVLLVAWIGLIHLWAEWIRRDERQRLARRMDHVSSECYRAGWYSAAGWWCGMAEVLRTAEERGWDK